MRSRNAYAVLLSVGMGLLLGVGAFTFIYARGYSYLTDDPSACANCHIMAVNYARLGHAALYDAEVSTPEDYQPPPQLVTPDSE